MGSSGSSARMATKELESLSLILMTPLSRPSLANVTRPEPDTWSYSHAPCHVNDTPAVVGFQLT
jgi:hypothetical protein